MILRRACTAGDDARGDGVGDGCLKMRTLLLCATTVRCETTMTTTTKCFDDTLESCFDDNHDDLCWDVSSSSSPIESDVGADRRGTLLRSSAPIPELPPFSIATRLFFAFFRCSSLIVTVVGYVADFSFSSKKIG